MMSIDTPFSSTGVGVLDDPPAIATPPQSLGFLIDLELSLLSPMALIQHLGAVIAMIKGCDEPVDLAKAIVHAGDIDQRLLDHRVSIVGRNAAAALRLWSMWRLGVWLHRAHLRGGDRRVDAPPRPVTLGSLGLEKTQACRCRRLAKVTGAVIENAIAEINRSERPLTYASLLRGVDRPAPGVTEEKHLENELPRTEWQSDRSPPNGRFVSQTLLDDLGGHARVLSTLLLDPIARARIAAGRAACEPVDPAIDEELVRLAIDDYARRLLVSIAQATGTDPLASWPGEPA